jgi:hypothetical protein
VIGKAERTSSDKKREHRHKKMRQREQRRDREKKERAVEKLRPGLGNKYSKARALRDLEHVTKSSNITQVPLSDMYSVGDVTKLLVGTYHSSGCYMGLASLWQLRFS